MASRNAFQNFLVGGKKIESRTDYKYALLRGQLGLLMSAIFIIYIPVDLANGVTVFIPWYLLGIGISASIIILNRKGNYIVSTWILLLFSNLLVYFFAAVDIPASGVFFFFSATAAIGLLMFYPINRIMSFFFVLLSLSLGLLAFFSDWSPLPPPLQSEQHVTINFTTNFIIGMMTVVLVLAFVMKRNKESEKSLIEQQKDTDDVAEELKKSRERFEMAVDGSRAGIYEWHIPTNTVYTSPRWYKLLGYEDNEVEVNVEFFMSLVHPEDAERTSKNIESAMMRGTYYNNELRMRRKDGQYQWFHDHGIIKLEDGAPTLAVGSIIDIHERKLAQNALQDKNEELEKINEELDRFVYSASHDMRAPLSTLLGLVQLAQQTEDKKELEKYFDMMSKRIYTMEGFIKEVTDYSRNARLDLEVEEVQLSSVVSDVVESFDLLSRQAEVTTEIKIDSEILLVTDEVRLKVIFNNLIANAIKYFHPDKKDRKVRIEADLDPQFCHVRVIDNGAGIPEKYMEKIFDMFFRASDKSDGSGLGLYIVKETLDRLGGSITCSSSDQGTTFEVSLPLVYEAVIPELQES